MKFSPAHVCKKVATLYRRYLSVRWNLEEGKREGLESSLPLSHRQEPQGSPHITHMSLAGLLAILRSTTELAAKKKRGSGRTPVRMRMKNGNLWGRRRRQGEDRRERFMKTNKKSFGAADVMWNIAVWKLWGHSSFLLASSANVWKSHFFTTLGFYLAFWIYCTDWCWQAAPLSYIRVHVGQCRNLE